MSCYYRAFNGVGGKHTYSETEQAVGNWLDGRTIYERTFVMNNITMPYGFTWFTLDLSNVADVISTDFYAYATSDVYDYCGLPIAFNRDTKAFGVMNNYSGSLGTVNAYITVRYVKSV